MRRLVLYAPNIHTGGGLVLLRALLSSWSRSDLALTAILDARARGELDLPAGSSVVWVVATVASRLKAEFDLRHLTSEPGCMLLCFHGLPPILPSKAKVVVFLQNRHYLARNVLSSFYWKTGIRLRIERLISRLFRLRVDTYIVQTPTMKLELNAWYQRCGSSKSQPDVLVLPFMGDLDALLEPHRPDAIYDFIYVADGEAHKNHRALLGAWELLAGEGLRPTLALTLAKRDDKLRADVASACRNSRLAIVDLGNLPHSEAIELYARARALIFPSTLESFGLPLIEASSVGLPILAGELDFVRDVCVPSETFDPSSSVSIARAVKRFLGRDELPISPFSMAVFWEKTLLQFGVKSIEING